MNTFITLEPVQSANGRSGTPPNFLSGQDLREYFTLLDRDDRLLLELTDSGLSHRRIAQILVVDCGTVSRRLRKLAGRLKSPISARLLDPACPLLPDYRQIGVEHFFIGKPIARIAAERGQTFCAVRQIVEQVRA